MKVDYLINDFRFSDNNIIVASSTGVIDFPKYKNITKRDWAERNGYIVDTDMLRLDARTIKLDCTVYANKLDEFMSILRKLYSQFNGLETLKIEFIGTGIELLFSVYLDGGITVTKEWREADMYGKFSMKLVESEPQKKIYIVPAEPFREVKYTFTYISTSPFSVYSCGMKQKMYAPAAEKEGEITITLRGNEYGNDYLIIAGNIDDITDLKMPNSKLIWDRI